MLNSVGLQNPGVKKFVYEELPALRNVFKKPVMANVCGSAPEEYAQVVMELEKADQIGWYEINISCPNVRQGGIAFGTDPDAAASVIKAVRKETYRPVIAKLSPNVSDITEIAKACESEGADALTAINTLLGMRIDRRTGRPILSNITGGLSGPAILPVALRCVYQVARAVEIPVIGCGGVRDAEDVIEMMMAGACAVQIGSANLVDPYACRKVIMDLPDAMKKNGWEVTGINFGGAADDSVTFKNKRAEMWARMKTWVEREEAILPERQDLKDDLTAPEYSYDTATRLVLEPKDAMKRRGLASPDIADALALTFAQLVYEPPEQESIIQSAILERARASRRTRFYDD